MAEILIKLTSYTNPDPTQDAWVYKSGDPVLVMPDGWAWGTSEGLPDFTKLRITDKTVAEVTAFLANELDASGNPIRRRRYRIDLATIADPYKTQLLQEGFCIATWIEVKRFILDKVTGKPVA